MSNKFILLRLPCLMEDEGRTFLISTHASKKEAKKALAAYISDGYFNRGNMQIAEVAGGHDE